MLEAALAHHQAGRLAEAERLYRQVLERDPGNADALHLLGVLAGQTGNPEDAVRLIRRALEVKPANAVFLRSLGDAYLNLGALLQARQRYDEAAALYRQALEIEPAFPAVYNNLGALYRSQNRPADAEAAYRRALQMRPEYPEAQNNLGQLLQDLERDQEAEAAYRAALRMQPRYAEAHNNLGSLLTRLQRFDEAEAALRAALALRPQYVEALNNYGNLLKELKRFEPAEAAFRDALALRPGHPEVSCNLGALLKEAGRLSESEATLRDLLTARPDYPEAHYNLGNLLRDLARYPEAEVAYRHALALRPGYAEATWNLGLLKLSLGQFAEGWPLYEARTRLGHRVATFSRPDVAFPRWAGEDLAGRSLLVWPEQGFGDEIQFARYVPLLKEKGAACITMVCRDPLARLFSTLHGADKVIAQSEAANVEPHDYWTFLLSVPGLVGTELQSIPSRLPYLQPWPADVARWRPRLPATGMRIGLVWKGRRAAAESVLNKRALDLRSLKPLWSVPGVSFVGLQKGEDENLPALGGQPMVSLGREIRDFADTAAIVAQLDLVISIDTAVAHLAGALGKPCWVMVSSRGSDWRWLLEREDSPWYPGALRLFRQRGDGWEETIEAITTALRVHAAR